jgi:tRNA threonylcarbamoyladenosine biosynthesis protein TsaE
VSRFAPSPFATTRPLADPEATADLGRALAHCLRPGDTLLLAGPIGAGKSHLARALIQCAASRGGGPVPEVPSPTYTLVQTYATGLGEIVHADLYRLGDTSELAELGLEDAFGNALVIVEWPDRMGDSAPDSALRLTLRPDGDARRAEMTTASPDLARRLAHLLQESPAP